MALLRIIDAHRLRASMMRVKLRQVFGWRETLTLEDRIAG
jgi:hypothetical protein